MDFSSFPIALPTVSTTPHLPRQHSFKPRRKRDYRSVPTAIARTNDFLCLQHPGTPRYFNLRTRGRKHFNADQACPSGTAEALARYVHHELERIRNISHLRLLDLRRIETLSDCFDRVLGHFTSHAPILSDIKQEYTQVLDALANLHHERTYLNSKAQALLSEAGTERMIDEERTKILELSFRIEMLKKENAELERLFLSEEEQYILSLAEAYRKDVRNAPDEKSRMALQHQGRWGYIEDWLEKGATGEPVIRETLYSMRKTPERIEAILEKEDSKFSEVMESPEVKRIKAEIEEQNRTRLSRQQEMSSIQQRMQGTEEAVKSMVQRIEEVEILLDVVRGRAQAKSQSQSQHQLQTQPQSKQSSPPEATTPVDREVEVEGNMETQEDSK
ncbi:hypothetical protein HDV00_000816 [Rhizophlyctis rosea]|nr:hypothetical protein HDV00_000816 [Rhizophlyctis rosea]